MATSASSSWTSVATLFGAAAALLSVACSAGAGNGEQEGIAMPEARLGSATGFASEPVEASDADHVQVLGKVDALTTDAAPNAMPEAVGGATVCLITAGTTTCTTTDEHGVYAFHGIAKTTEPAEIVVTSPGFATTETTLSLESDASHMIGLVPESVASDSEHGIVLVRSLVKAYSMTELTPGVDVTVTVGERTYSTQTTGYASAAVVTGVEPGAFTASGSAKALRCEVWGGSSLTSPKASVVRPGVVTQIDVLCNVDLNDRR